MLWFYSQATALQVDSTVSIRANKNKTRKDETVPNFITIARDHKLI